MKRHLMVMIFPLILAGNFGFAEEYPDWEGFPPMYTIKDIIEFNGYIFGATNGGLFRYDPSTQEYKLFYKGHGLINNDVLCIGATSQELYIGYQEDGLWRFDPDSGSGKQILFPEYHVKTLSTPNGIAVRNIYALNDSILYIGHALGMDMLNLYTEELRTYTNLGPKISESTPVNEVKVFGGRIWVCTPNGLAVADEDNPNLEFEENWESYTYKKAGITSIIHVDDEYENIIYLGTDIEGFVFFDEEKDKIGPLVSWEIPNPIIYKLTERQGTYWAATNKGLYKKKGTRWKLEDKTFTGLSDLAVCEDNKLWVGTMLDGMQCYADSGYVDIPPPSKLWNNTLYDIDITHDNTLWGATALRDIIPNSRFQRLEDYTWTAYDSTDGDWTTQVVCTLVDRNGLVWAGLWGGKNSGLYVIYDDGTPAKFQDIIEPVDITREIIKPTVWWWYVVCPDLAEDKHGNVWVANLQLDPPDHIIESVPTSGAVVLDGFPLNRYQHYSPAEDELPTATITKLCTDEDGWVWLATPHKGLIGLYVGDDPFDKSDTEVHHLTLSEGLHSMRINALARDLEGYIWVGTEAGLNRITKNNGHELLVEDMNEALGDNDRDIKAIEIDRLNNKWIGTTGGLIKLDAQNELETVYTIENSGLFSDDIVTLKYYDKDDILWVSTSVGLNKFTVFSEKTTETVEDIHVYPNPYEIWGYDFNAVFTNLKPGSEIRIYTFTGVLVNELTVGDNAENGISTVTWNGRNFEGRYVGSGVYFFTGVNARGQEFKDKLVVVRR